VTFTKVTTEYNAEKLENLPGSRDYASVTLFLPGVNQSRPSVGGTGSVTYQRSQRYGIVGHDRGEVEGIVTTEAAAGGQEVGYSDVASFDDMVMNALGNGCQASRRLSDRRAPHARDGRMSGNPPPRSTRSKTASCAGRSRRVARPTDVSMAVTCTTTSSNRLRSLDATAIKAIRSVPGVATSDFDMFFHTDLETPETVPWTGLDAVTRAYARIVDEVNKLPLADLKRPEDADPRAGATTMAGGDR
ncbi:MAG: hypothetical protein ACREMY_16540, partial [bacterium]